MTEADLSHPQWRRSSHRELWLSPMLVWLLLMAILAASVWSAFFPLGPFNPAINLLLAALMLLVLAVYLMDLRSASPVLRMVAAAGLFWVVFLFALTFTDYLSRRPTEGIMPLLQTSALTRGLYDAVSRSAAAGDNVRIEWPT